ncbi:MAG: helix-turn-helix domain-containing protein [Comamonadaceae bacterium]|nr:MAG: helix-turn-helix domain-containing protein [Comamonadaceae bacterium]
MTGELTLAAHLEYSTQTVEAPRRFAYWNDVVCRHCIPAASRMLADGPFDATLDCRSVGVVSISAMSAPLHQWSRDSHHLRMGPDDDLWIGYMREGEGVISQGGRQAVLKSGDMALYDAARPFEFSLAAKSIYLVRLPRNSILQRFAIAERMTARLIDNSRPGVLPLRSMLFEAATTEFDRSRPAVPEQFSRTVLDLLAVTLEMQLGNDEVPVRRDLHGRLMAYVHQHLGDTDLSLQSLADAHHVSSRTVTRAFAAHDQTAMGAVWQARLDASRSALVEGRCRSVTEAAFDHGFSDVSHFGRAFRKAFGCAPHTLIRGH